MRRDTSHAPRPQTHVSALDGLRGLAIVLVLLRHLTERAQAT